MQLQNELDTKDDEISRMQIKLQGLMEEVNRMRGVRWKGDGWLHKVEWLHKCDINGFFQNRNSIYTL